MENVLEVYHRPCNPRFPVICMDEASKQLVGEVRQPLPLRPGQPKPDLASAGLGGYTRLRDTRIVWQRSQLLFT